MAAASGAQNRTLILAVSAAGHGVALAVLVWRLGVQTPTAEPTVMSVQLVTPFRPPAADLPPRRGPTRPVEGRRAATPSQPADVAPLVVPQAPPTEPVGEQVRQALRGLVGCRHADLAGLSEAEREGCREKLASGGSRKLALRRDAEFGASRSDVPYLNRRPKNGCKVMAAGAKPLMGKDGATAGFGCAWDF